jgi:hypothetical protein
MLALLVGGRHLEEEHETRRKKTAAHLAKKREHAAGCYVADGEEKETIGVQGAGAVGS